MRREVLLLTDSVERIYKRSRKMGKQILAQHQVAMEEAPTPLSSLVLP